MSKPFIMKPKKKNSQIFIIVLVLRIFIILKVCWLCPSLWNVERVSSGFTKQVRKRAMPLGSPTILLLLLLSSCVVLMDQGLPFVSPEFPATRFMLLSTRALVDYPSYRHSLAQEWRPEDSLSRAVCIPSKALPLNNSSAIIFVIPQPEVLYKLVTFIIPLWVMFKGRFNYCLKKQPH